MAEAAKQYEVVKTDEEWRKILTPEQYQVMRRHGTERPGSCALLHRASGGHLLVRGLRQSAVCRRQEVRERYRVAELLCAARRRGGDVGRRQPLHAPCRGPLQSLRQPSRPRLRGWSAANRAALLHQRCGAEVRAGGSSQLDRSQIRSIRLEKSGSKRAPAGP